MAMTRKELSEILGEKTLFPASKCAEFVDMVFKIMAETWKGEKKSKSRDLAILS